MNMGKLLLLGILGLLLLHTPVFAEMEILNETRHVYPRLTANDGQSYWDWEDVHGSGQAVLSAEVQHLSGYAEADQNSLIQQVGDEITLSGSFHNATGATEAGDILVQGSVSYLSLWVRSDGPFQVTGTVECSVTGAAQGILKIYQSNPSGPMVHYQVFGQGSHGVDVLLEGEDNQYVLELTGEIYAHLPDMGPNTVDSTFDLVIAPEGTVSTEQGTWDRVKSLYR